MDKVEYGAPCTPEHVVKYNELYGQLDKRIRAIFELWKQRRKVTGASWAVPHSWESAYIAWWCIATDSRKPDGQLEVMVGVPFDYECEDDWCFSPSLLYVSENELEQAVAAAFRSWVNEERKRMRERMPQRPAWKQDPEPWEYDDEMEPEDKRAFVQAEKARWGSRSYDYPE